MRASATTILRPTGAGAVRQPVGTAAATPGATRARAAGPTAGTLVAALLILAAVPYPGAALLPPAAWAQDGSAVAVAVAAQDEPVEIGGYLVLTIALAPGPGSGIEPGSVAVTVAAGDGPLLNDPYPLRDVVVPAGAGQRAEYEWAAPVAVRTVPGRYPLTATVAYRLTEDPPDAPARTASWQGEVAFDHGPGWRAEKITHLVQSRGLPLFLLLVFGFGVLMSFTPCVYPMIPITLAVIGAQNQDKGLGRGFLIALTYGLGLALTYAVIGAVSATVFSGITAYLQSPLVLVPIALLMVALSLAMFGAYELQAPAFLRNRLQGPGGNRAGIAGAFLMGMVAGLVASPCVGPFLGALLIWVGTTGSLMLGFWTLFVFGLGISTLLVLVGTFPAAMGSLPRSGGWMETVKRTMGLLLLYMAFYFVRPPLVLPEQVFYPLLGAVTVVVAIYMGALDGLTAGAHWWQRTRKGLGLVLLVVGIYVLGGALVRYGLLLPDAGSSAGAATPSGSFAGAPGPADPRSGATLAAGVGAEAGDRGNPSDGAGPGAAGEPGDTVAADEEPLPDHVPWEVVRTGEDVRGFLDSRRAEAVRAGRPMVVDFWATWCKFCLQLDKQVWSRPAVVGESLRFVTVKVDATRTDEEMAAIWAEYGVAGLPTVVFIDSRGELLAGKTVVGFVNAEQMLSHMQSIR
ncbi:MAG: cytochrome c biogenesis protein CcdA [Candidatus Krumholzibacteriia bacterium]